MRDNPCTSSWIALLATLAACGGDGAAGSGPPGAGSGAQIAKSELPGAVASALCEALAPCCSEANRPIDDPAKCESVFSSSLAEAIKAADPHKYTYDPQGAAACVRAMRETSLCDSESSMQGLCKGAFAGTVPPGGACAASMECAIPAGGDGGCIMRPDGRMACAVKPTAAEGESCYWTCTRESGSSSCFASEPDDVDPPEQGRCFTDDGLYCTSSRTCARRGDQGASCSGFVESCRDGLFCESTSHTCRARLVQGDSCRVESESCAEGSFCKGGTCVEEIADGAACMPFMDKCDGGSACPTAGVCGESESLRDVGVQLICELAGS